MGKKMIDKTIKIDLTKMPKSILEEIKELERLNDIEDWFSYDLKFYELESNSKGYVIRKQISESDYKKLMIKYGGYYD